MYLFLVLRMMRVSVHLDLLLYIQVIYKERQMTFNFQWSYHIIGISQWVEQWYQKYVVWTLLHDIIMRPVMR